MIALLFGGLFALVQLGMLVRAVARSSAEKFALGTVGGVVRIVLLVAGGIAYFRAAAGSMAAATSAPSIGVASTILAAEVLGPLVSFVVLAVAYRRTRVEVPALEEKKLSGPFDIWLPIASIDALGIVVLLLGSAIMRDV